jgi:hypothetical protein
VEIKPVLSGDELILKAIQAVVGGSGMNIGTAISVPIFARCNTE